MKKIKGFKMEFYPRKPPYIEAMDRFMKALKLTLGFYHI